MSGGGLSSTNAFFPSVPSMLLPEKVVQNTQKKIPSKTNCNFFVASPSSRRTFRMRSERDWSLTRSTYCSSSFHSPLMDFTFKAIFCYTNKLHCPASFLDLETVSYCRTAAVLRHKLQSRPRPQYICSFYTDRYLLQPPFSFSLYMRPILTKLMGLHDYPCKVGTCRPGVFIEPFFSCSKVYT